MAHPETTSLPILEARVKEIIELGKSWGMSDSDIQECLDASATEVDAFHSTTNPTKSNNVRIELGSVVNSVGQGFGLVWCFVKYAVGCCLLVFLTLGVLYSAILIASSLSPSFEHALGKKAADLVYPSMRLARILFKPLADRFDIADVYNAECLVDNPFFVDPVEDCEPCMPIVKFLDMTGQPVKKMRRNIDEVRPFIIKGYMKSPVHLTELQKMYFENERRFSFGGSRSLNSNLDNVYNISDFFYKYNNEDLMNAQRGIGYVNWVTNDVPSSQAIRKVFPRPSFIPDGAEVSLTKRIIIEAPLSGRHELPTAGFVNCWYLQSQGSRRFTLIPHPGCVEDCKAVSILVDAGDIVFFQDQFWRLLSEPLIGSDGGPVVNELSIGYAGSFSV